MTTPNKAQIEQYARELYVQECYRHGTPELADLNPELTELRESGFITQAVSELMRDNIRCEAEQWSVYSEACEQSGFKFDTTEAMQTTTFISGSRGSGKSDIAMLTAELMKTEDVNVAVFDSSLDWLKRSGITDYLTVQPHTRLEVPTESQIFDISQLTPLQQQRAVENFNKILFEEQLRSDTRFYLIFEEAQLIFPLNAIRSKRCQNSMRLLTVGRNVGVSMCAISQFPSAVDKELVKNSQQLYIGCTSEPNTLSYWSGILGSETAKLKDLQNGEFLYYNRNKIEKISIQPFENIAVKNEVFSAKPFAIAATPQQQDYNALLKLGTVTFLGLLLLLIGVC